MDNWKSVLKADPTDWLLEKENPSVRYFTLIDILNVPATSPEVIEAKAGIMTRGAVPVILSKQEAEGYWGIARDFYVRAKYRGTVWQLIVLAELGADGTDPRVKKACDFVFQNSQDRQSGGFAYQGTPENGGQHSGVIPCLTGNMVWSMIRLGCLDDPRLQRGIDWIAAYQRFDDRAPSAPKGWPYDKREPCWGRHTCHMGVMKALNALAEVPPERRSKGVQDCIRSGVEYILAHHIHKRSHDLTKVSKPGWLHFGFPLMYNSDVLDILGILTKLGYRDARMQEAIDLVISKQDNQGRWLLENTFNGRFLVNIERKDHPSKWITLNALRVLKRLDNPA